MLVFVCLSSRAGLSLSVKVLAGVNPVKTWPNRALSGPPDTLAASSSTDVPAEASLVILAFTHRQCDHFVLLLVMNHSEDKRVLGETNTTVTCSSFTSCCSSCSSPCSGFSAPSSPAEDQTPLRLLSSWKTNSLMKEKEKRESFCSGSRITISLGDAGQWHGAIFKTSPDVYSAVPCRCAAGTLSTS